ncbi:MAG TPA: hypothetical protein VNZ52_04260, partial [Candidatus Thermoplasmatota archaeon]|nr:hypothetical protein [Candidatus Thermoplasmatota archaeon]
MPPREPRPWRSRRLRLGAAAALAVLCVLLLGLLLVALDTPPGAAPGGEGPGSGGGSGSGTGTGSGSGSGSGNGNSGRTDLEAIARQQQDCTLANILGGTVAGLGVLLPAHAFYQKRSRREITWKGGAGLALVALGGLMILSCNWIPEGQNEPPTA